MEAPLKHSKQGSGLIWVASTENCGCLVERLDWRQWYARWERILVWAQWLDEEEIIDLRNEGGKFGKTWLDVRSSGGRSQVSGLSSRVDVLLIKMLRNTGKGNGSKMKELNSVVGKYNFWHLWNFHIGTFNRQLGVQVATPFQWLSRVRLYDPMDCSTTPTPGACSNSGPSSRWCHPPISSSVVPFCLQSFPASGSFSVGQFFASGGQNIRWQLKRTAEFNITLHWFLTDCFLLR